MLNYDPNKFDRFAEVLLTSIIFVSFLTIWEMI